MDEERNSLDISTSDLVTDSGTLNPNYDTLVLSGASIKGILTLGALQYCYDNYLLNDVTIYIGTSSGALIGYLLAIGYTPVEIMVYICTHGVIEKLQPLDFNKMINGGGATSFQPVQEEMEKMTISKIGRLITLKELYNKFGKKLICVTHVFNKKEGRYISMDTYPDTPCLTAIAMSSMLPFLFDKFEYMGEQYVDGAFTNNFAIDVGDKMGNKILGIYACYKSIPPFNTDTTTALLQTIYRLIITPIEQACEYRIEKASDKCTIIRLYNDGNFIEFNVNNINATDKLEMFSNGYQTTKEIFENK